MRITDIRQQLKRAGRYSVYIDGAYAFSLSDSALLDSAIAVGDELTEAKAAALKRRSADDKIYDLALRYLALRPRSVWELQTYLERKNSPAPLVEQITNKFRQQDLLNDDKFARAFVADRRQLKPTSRRKLVLELRKKHIDDETIRTAVGDEPADERAALQEIVERKRRQTRYQDDLKLMQYLARQGFTYDDIKQALRPEAEEL